MAGRANGRLTRHHAWKAFKPRARAASAMAAVRVRKAVRASR